MKPVRKVLFWANKVLMWLAAVIAGGLAHGWLLRQHISPPILQDPVLDFVLPYAVIFGVALFGSGAFSSETRWWGLVLGLAAAIPTMTNDIGLFTGKAGSILGYFPFGYVLTRCSLLGTYLRDV